MTPARYVIFCVIMKYVYLLKLLGSDIAEPTTDAHAQLYCCFVVRRTCEIGFIDLVACVFINNWMAKIDHDHIMESIMKPYITWHKLIFEFTKLMCIDAHPTNWIWTDMQQLDRFNCERKKKSLSINIYGIVWADLLLAQRCPVNDHNNMHHNHHNHAFVQSCSVNTLNQVYKSNDSNEVGARAHIVQFSRTLALAARTSCFSCVCQFNTFQWFFFRVPSELVFLVFIFFAHNLFAYKSVIIINYG